MHKMLKHMLETSCLTICSNYRRYAQNAKILMYMLKGRNVSNSELYVIFMSWLIVSTVYWYNRN